MFRKLLAVGTMITMIAGLTACGSSPSASSATTAGTTTAGTTTAGETTAGEAAAGEADGDYKIGLMVSPLASREEFYRTAELLVEQYGKDKFIVDVYPEEPQNEQEVTISKSLNIAMDPAVKVMIFDSADIGTIAAVNKIREERTDIKILFGSLNEDVYEMAKTGDLMITLDPEGYGNSVAQMAANTGAKHFVFYSFARHMSNSMKVRYMEAMKATCEENGVAFEQVTMPDPMGDAGITGAQQFMLESIPSIIDQYDTKDVAFYATVSTIQESMLKTVVENGGIYPCHTDPSPFSAFSGALGLEIDEEHKYDAEYVTKLISDKLGQYNMNGRVGGWEKSMVRCDMEFLFQYAIDYCEGKLNEVDGKPDVDEVRNLITSIYDKNATYKNCVNDTTGEEYLNWFTYTRDLYVF